MQYKVPVAPVLATATALVSAIWESDFLLIKSGNRMSTSAFRDGLEYVRVPFSSMICYGTAGQEISGSNMSDESIIMY